MTPPSSPGRRSMSTAAGSGAESRRSGFESRECLSSARDPGLGTEDILMRRLIRILLIPLALIFLFEAWLWNQLAPVVAWVVARVPLHALKARIAAFIERLPPAATLIVFIVPVLLLLPLKFLG